MQEKTVIQWLEWAKAQGYEWADKAIYNATSEGDMLNVLVKSLSSAISGGFTWLLWEGYEYWEEIYDSLSKNKL